MEPGSIVNIHLIEPTERFWGKLLDLNQAGATVRGIDVNLIETFKYQFRGTDRPVFPQTIFFPMRRIQQIDLDEPMNDLPSTIESVKKISAMSEERLFR